MGVPGLWELLRPAATRTSLSALARDAFVTNKNGLCALTIGIDASIWVFHASGQSMYYGENGFLRTIFYRVSSLLQHPVLPLFVFDGPNKPSQKRGQRVAGHFGTNDIHSRQFKELLDVCGLEWWNAPGEAEAELAVLNRQGKLDAVLSDDVDALLFGATCLLRNNSPTLSGAQASATGTSSKLDLRNYEMYRVGAIQELWRQREGTSLKTEEDCRMAMILIALLAGGDYAPEGVANIGPTIAHGLAHAGVADFLRQYDSKPSAFRASLAAVRENIMEELRTDQSGFLGRRYKACASKLEGKSPHELFATAALDGYLRPATSPVSDSLAGWPGFGVGEPSQRRGTARNQGRGDLEGMARACEKYFEWGTRELVGKKFAGESVGLFGSEIVNDARNWIRSRIAAPGPSSPPRRRDSSRSGGRITSFFASVQPSTQITAKALHTQTHESRMPIPPYLIKIHSKRENNEVIEYRVSYRTDDFVARCHNAMDGTRVDPKLLPASEKAKLGLVGAEELDVPSSSQPSTAPKDEVRVWLPDYILQAWPDLIRVYEDGVLAKEEAKKAKKTGGRSRPKKVVKSKEDREAFRTFFKGKSAQAASEEEIEPVETRPILPRSTPPRSVSTIDLTDSPDTHPALRASPSLPEIAKRCREPSSSSRSSASTQVARVPTRIRSSPKKVTKPPRRSARLSIYGVKGNKDAPIDLCSSDDEPPQPSKPIRKPRKPPAPFPMLALASGLGPPTPKRQSRNSSPVLGTSRSRTKISPHPSQTRLDLALIKSSQTSGKRV